MADESMAHAMHGMAPAYKLGNIEMKKKKRVYHLRWRNIEISEKTKHVEDLGHDVRTDINIRKYGNTFYIGIAMVVLPSFGLWEN